MQEDIEARDHFMFVLDWLLAVHERHPAKALDFSLLHVCFHDQQKLGQVYGAPEAYHMLAELSGKLRHAFRRTDLVARNGSDFWILAPCTTPETLREKINMLVEISVADGLNIVDRDVTVFSPSDLIRPDQAPLSSAAAFLDYLKKDCRAIACHWEHEAPAN
jgi:GGDEF domain-containing protein